MALFDLLDCETDFAERYFWLNYVATTDAGVNVDDVSLWWERGGATILYEKSLSETRHDKLIVMERIEQLTNEYPFDMDYELRYDDDPEFPRIELECWDESFEYFPDVDNVSEIFGKILK